MPRDLERQTGPKSTGPTVRSICEALNHISISFRSNCKHITRAGARRRNDKRPSTQGHLIAHVGGCYSHRKATCPPQDITTLAFHAICFRRLFFFFSDTVLWRSLYLSTMVPFFSPSSYIIRSTVL